MSAGLLAVLAACGGGDADGATADTGGSSSPVPGDTAASPASWTVTETGWGRVRAGMTLAEAGTALGAQLSEPRSRECDHVRPPVGPAGVLLMVVGGRVARVEVTDTTVTTAAGVRVGDSEARVDTLYRGRVERRPHKYVDGRYLIVRPAAAADSMYRILFETDGRRVTRFRAGRLPEVEWVEGCG